MKKVIIIKIGAIGDVIRSLTMLDNLKGYDITWVCGKIASCFVKSAGVVKVIEVDEKKLFQGSFFEKVFELIKTWKKIGFFKTFDLKIIGHHDSRYELIALFTRSKEKRKFTRKLGKMNPIPGRSFTSEYARLSNQDGTFSTKTVFPKIKYQESKLVQEIFFKDEKVICLAPGGANNILNPDNLRRWPIENYVSLAKSLLEKGYRVLLTGGKDDEWTLKYFDNVNVESFIGKTSLMDLYGIYKKSQLLITHDCGPLHIGMLAKTKVLGIFGPTEYRTVVGEPFYPHINVIYKKELSCSPCYDGKYFVKCKNNFCMQEISSDEVLKEALKIIK
jgi:heptosyltransferase II